jgi:hypothetical protein
MSPRVRGPELLVLIVSSSDANCAAPRVVETHRLRWDLSRQFQVSSLRRLAFEDPVGGARWSSPWTCQRDSEPCPHATMSLIMATDSHLAEELRESAILPPRRGNGPVTGLQPRLTGEAALRDGNTTPAPD